MASPDGVQGKPPGGASLVRLAFGLGVPVGVPLLLLGAAMAPFGLRQAAGITALDAF